MAAVDLQPELLLPNKRFWIVGPTYELGEKEFRYVWQDMIVGLGLGRDKRVRKQYSKNTGNMWIEFPWQTRVEVKSAQHPESLVGDALHGVIMSEAAKHKEHTWERYIRPALADYRGWGTFPTTPEGFNWYYHLWRNGWRDNQDALDSFQSWRFPSWANKIVYPGGREDPEILLLEQTTTPEWFAQEIGAEFTSFVGKIYSDFTEADHVIDDYEFQPLWPNYIAFDWGFTSPLAAIEFQVSPWDEIFVWREHYKSYWTLPEHLDYLRNRDNPPGYRLDMAFGDAADPAAAITVSRDLVSCVAEPRAKENWREGVNVVKQFLKLHQVGELDEFGTPKLAPHLYISRTCSNTVSEFQQYRRKENPGGNEAAKQGPVGPEIPDHALDALRYGLVHLYVLYVDQHLGDVEERVKDWFIIDREYNDDSATELWIPEMDEAESFFTMPEGGMSTMGMRF
jgi:hypothetical protein